MTGDERSVHLFGIADSVPEEFRMYAVLHEFIEFLEIGEDSVGRCEAALVEELRIVPLEIKNEYMRMRRDFFANLIDFYRDEGLPKTDIAEFERSLSRLEGMLRQI
ncbi:MAG: hypothetical protein Q8P57_01090 [Candidatus Pacearchaeota archaeon]|nr:hypothetical protein [Candidatus Pacearchaeota archaeon]